MLATGVRQCPRLSRCITKWPRNRYLAVFEIAAGSLPRATAISPYPFCYTSPVHTLGSHERRHTSTNVDTNPAQEQSKTDFRELDILGNIPAPSTSIDICLHNGFRLNNGLHVMNSGVLLVGGEAFAWQPWVNQDVLVGGRGQWEVGNESFALLSHVWPRPDLLILGVGGEIRPLSPETKKYITALGMRVEVLDTRNAASQFNLLATERGIDDIAAALVPAGWPNNMQ